MRRAIAALGNDLMPIGWGDSTGVMFAKARSLGRLSRLFKIDLTTGRRQPVGEIGPTDPRGAPFVLMVQVSRDGSRYAYYMSLPLTTVVLIEGVKP